MATVFLRPRAQLDLIEIWNYIADDSEAQADAFIDKFGKKFELLAERPKVGSPRDELHRDLRSFPLGRYIVFYLPTPDGVDIVRVLHGTRDFAPEMFEDR